MTYDPFQNQNNAALGVYAGAGNPFLTPFTAMQTSAIHPSLINPYVNHAQAGLWQNPLLHAGLQNGFAQNPYVQQLAAQQLAQHILAQQAAQQLAALNQQTGFYGQGGPIGITGQTGMPFGQMAPQSWVGQAGQAGGGQANAILLAQLTARALQAQGLAQGLTPGVGFPL